MLEVICVDIGRHDFVLPIQESLRLLRLVAFRQLEVVRERHMLDRVGCRCFTAVVIRRAAAGEVFAFILVQLSRDHNRLRHDILVVNVLVGRFLGRDGLAHVDRMLADHCLPHHNLVLAIRSLDCSFLLFEHFLRRFELVQASEDLRTTYFGGFDAILGAD